jgi:hypothetical protein
MIDALAISKKRALSRGLKRPNPSAMFDGVERAESRIWSRYLKSLDAGPVAVNVKTSHFN